MLEKIEQTTRGRMIMDGQPLTPLTSDTSPTGYVGYCRDVYLAGDYVIKWGGSLCHLNEAGLFIEEEDRKYFAEVVYVSLDKSWYAMKRINCVPDPSINSEHAAAIHRIIRKYEIDDVFYFPCTKRAKNWTVDVNGNPMIFDYDFHSRGEEFEDSFDGEDSWFPTS
jgi:hypothetical protein